MQYGTFSQSTGEFRDPAGTSVGFGYSGNGEGLCNPAWQYTTNIGPIPHGFYAIGAPFTHPICGPFTMRLSPIMGTNLRGRDGFMCHGGLATDEIDGTTISPASPDKSASDGCVIAVRSVRELIDTWGILQVIP